MQNEMKGLKLPRRWIREYDSHCSRSGTTVPFSSRRPASPLSWPIHFSSSTQSPDRWLRTSLVPSYRLDHLPA